MSKTLTEQWREGTLPEDCYYILTKNGHIRKDRTCFYSHTDEQCFCFIPNKDIEEVLAPVPSYNECNKLRKLPLKCFQLEEDNSALMVINKDMCKEIESLQEQIKEANEVIKGYSKLESLMNCALGPTENCPSQKYIERYGVK